MEMKVIDFKMDRYMYVFGTSVQKKIILKCVLIGLCPILNFAWILSLFIDFKTKDIVRDTEE